MTYSLKSSVKHKAFTQILWGLALFTVASAGWAAGQIPEPIASVLFMIPFWLFISFGTFLLGYLGFQLMRFKNKYEAYEAIQKDIKEATDWLKKHGIDVET